MAKKVAAAKIGDVTGADAVKSVAAKARRKVEKPRATTLAHIIEKYGRPGEWTPDTDGLPVDCRVKALGKADNDFYFLDSSDDFRRFGAREFSQNMLWSLFAPEADMAVFYWPRISQNGVINGVSADAAYRRLMDACAQRGYFDPAEQLRGRGCWRGDNRELIYFDGQYLWTGARGEVKPLEALEHQQYIYPRRPKIHEPWEAKVSDDNNPSLALIIEFKRWNFERPDVDPILLFGWLVASLIGAALDFRPVLFITGNAATGKTALQNVIKAIHGRGILKVEDTTPAGIYQSVKFDSLPVAIDEIEADENTERAQGILRIARIAATGGKLSRGSSDAKAMEFIARNAFFFSAILRPPLQPQDLSRMVTLRLRPHEQIAEAKGEIFTVNINQDTVAPLLLRKIFDEWHRFPATILAYRAALAQGGHGGRGMDVYATLLACADLCLPPEQAEKLHLGPGDLSFWTRELSVENLPDMDKPREPWEKLLSHLFTVQVPVWRSGGRQTVAQVIDDMVSRPGQKWDEGQELLAQTGLRMEEPGIYHKTSAVLCVPNGHSSLWKLFERSSWGGANFNGTWAETLRRAPGEIVLYGNPADPTDKNFNVVKVAGKTVRCGLVIVDEAMKRL